MSKLPEIPVVKPIDVMPVKLNPEFWPPQLTRRTEHARAFDLHFDYASYRPEAERWALALKRRGKPPRVGPEPFPAVPYPEPMFVPPPWEGGDGNAVKERVRKPEAAAAS